MNQEKNNEIDLMLRRLGRESNGSSERSAGDQHLDADELNMYAENVLVPATRARYTEHLADCSQCREIVSKLTLAAGGVLHEKKAIVPASSGIKDLLSRLFSPMVLRYAAPALVLVIITSIGFWVFTDSWSRKSVTQNESAQSVAKNEPAPPATSITNAVQNDSKETPSPAQPAKQSADTRQREEQQPTATPGEAAKETEERKRDEQIKVTDQVAAVPANVSGASAPAAPQPVVSTEKAGEAAVAKKNKAAEPPPSARDEAAGKTAESKAEYQPKTAMPGASRSPAKLRGAPVDRVQQEREVDEPAGRRDKDDAETKSVAGRQFRKEGSAWIDVAYRSQATTNISRGSEQYRALVADEPSIRTIADQLNGEVIVVWKGRAYRIR